MPSVRIRRAVAVVILAVLGAAAAVALKAGPRPEAPRPALASAQDGRVYGLGTVEARVLSRLGFEVAGTLAGLEADQGDGIAQGQVLARLDSRHQQARVGQAEAALRQAQAVLAQAQARLERARTVRDQRHSVNERRQALVKRGTVSLEAAEDAFANSATAAADVTVAASDLEAARAGVDAARAVLQLEQAVLAKYILLAPYDAVVVERSLELGASVAPGTAAFTVLDPASVWVRAFVDEALAGRLEPGQRAEITLRSQPGRAYAGKVVRIDMENDRVSEERRVHVAFDAIPRPFHLGEQAEVLISAPAFKP
ncbi:MAG: efflux RND transporter periplasmic adaptor subunit [Solirubrobacterales bacterium]